MHKKRLLIASTLILLGLILSGMTACAGPPKTVKIALAFPTIYGSGAPGMDGAMLAYNEAGGKAGRVNVEVVQFDTIPSDADGNVDWGVGAAKEKDAATQAAADPDVVAYIGMASSDWAKGAIPVLNQAGIAAISSTASWPGLTKPGYGAGEPGIYYPTGQRNFFRISAVDDAQGVAAAYWAKSLGYQTVYIVDNGAQYTSGVTGIFEVTAQDAGLEVVAHDQYDVNSTETADIQALAVEVAQAEPDLVYYAGYASVDAPRFIEALHTENPDIPIMGPDSLMEAQMILTVDAAVLNNTYATSITVPADQLDIEAADTFVANFEATYGSKPGSTAMAAYEATKMVLYAIEKAKNPTREGVLESLADLGEYSGIFGTWTFDSNGDIVPSLISGWLNKDGAWSFVEVVTPP